MKKCELCSLEHESVKKRFCKECAKKRRAEKFKTYKKTQRSKYSEEYKEELRARKRLKRALRREKGLCTECGRIPLDGFTVCQICLDQNKKATTKYNRNKGHKPAGSSSAEEYIAGLIDGFVVVRRYRRLIKSPKTNAWLEIDLWLPEIRLAIEIDGPMHRPNSGYGTERYLYQQFQDSIKDKACSDLNVELLRIPTNAEYWHSSEQIKIILSQTIRRAKSRMEGATHNS